ncbi:MAG: glycoside hydrolase family 3 protein, partial [Paraglaciecola sp.]|nr:glycoside hydrolase family 3 protein [Paraglaciecola sp.]
MFLRNKVLVISALLTTISCAVKPSADMQLRQLVAQKLMLDFRYFCKDDRPEQNCTTALTSLAPELADLITDTGIGGVVLFADNLDNTEQ